MSMTYRELAAATGEAGPAGPPYRADRTALRAYSPSCSNEPARLAESKNLRNASRPRLK